MWENQFHFIITGEGETGRRRGGKDSWTQDEDGWKTVAVNKVEGKAEVNMGTSGEFCASILGDDDTICEGSRVGD